MLPATRTLRAQEAWQRTLWCSLDYTKPCVGLHCCSSPPAWGGVFPHSSVTWRSAWSLHADLRAHVRNRSPRSCCSRSQRLLRDCANESRPPPPGALDSVEFNCACCPRHRQATLWKVHGLLPGSAPHCSLHSGFAQAQNANFVQFSDLVVAAREGQL